MKSPDLRFAVRLWQNVTVFVDSDLIPMLRKAGDAPGRKTVGLVLGLLSIKTL